jgi:two-component system chemotaxis sensor kinase CheA
MLLSWEYHHEPMIEMYVFETTNLIEQLEQLILDSEKTSSYLPETVNEIFRIMHTIKGASAMMLFNNIATLTHSIEDLFFLIREQSPKNLDSSAISDIILESIDFIKVEIEKIKNGDLVDGDASAIIENITELLSVLKQENSLQELNEEKQQVDASTQQYYISQDKSIDQENRYAYRVVIYFEEGSEMENIRAYTVIHNLKDITNQFYYFPDNIIDSDDSIETIRNQGFKILLKANKSYDEILGFFKQTVFLKDLELVELENDEAFIELENKSSICLDTMPKKPTVMEVVSDDPTTMEVVSDDPTTKRTQGHSQQSIISVNVGKLDKLMDLVGEMVIAEAMVTQNPDLKDLELDNFLKAARHLRKITSELQDMVMSIRMVPLATTFHKMHRIVRDMCKKLGKEVRLEILGEDTEVDKNIIEHISDPIMHLVRNAIDHGIESPKDRKTKGKAGEGVITLEAKNSGSDVLIIIRDDGKGLNKEKILQKARENGLIHKPESEMTDKEIYNLIFLPGFSTKESITEFSGRGVGMDVVTKNIESVGGSIAVDSIFNQGTVITLKIPLTLAIIDGMNIKVGKSYYTIPTISIKESFKVKEDQIINDPDGNEMIMVRGQCLPILRLHERYRVSADIVHLSDGIIIMVTDDDKTLCIFADELVGQQQVVVKTLPNYIKNMKKIKGLAGCTLLGDGSISLILDVAGFIKN